MGQPAMPQEGQSLLRRKLVRKRAADEASAKPAPPRASYGERALARACAAIDGDLQVTPRATASRRVGQAELLDLVETDGLTILLTSTSDEDDDSPGDGIIGILSLDRVAFLALVEILTTGRLIKGERAARRATPTDAALLADFIDRLLDLRRVEAAKLGSTVPECQTMWQRGRLIANARLLPALLEEGAFDAEQIELSLSLDGEERRGRFLLGLPTTTASPVAPGDDKAEGISPAGSEVAEWGARVEAMVMAVPTRLDAVLGRIAMPLEEALQLEPGSRLTLPISQLEEVRLETADHRPLALARLGQYRSMRALRLTSLFENGLIEPSLSLPHGAAPPPDAPTPVAPPARR